MKYKIHYDNNDNVYLYCFYLNLVHLTNFEICIDHKNIFKFF